MNCSGDFRAFGFCSDSKAAVDFVLEAVVGRMNGKGHVGHLSAFHWHGDAPTPADTDRNFNVKKGFSLLGVEYLIAFRNGQITRLERMGTSEYDDEGEQLQPIDMLLLEQNTDSDPEWGDF